MEGFLVSRTPFIHFNFLLDSSEDSDRQIIVFLVFHCNTEKKLYDPKQFLDLGKCKISRVSGGSQPGPNPGVVGALRRS